MEIFRPVKGYEKEYEISNIGNVRSIRSGKILKPNTDKSGYKYFVFSVNSNRHTMKAHRLVADAFIPNPESKPTVDHINGIRTDNRVSNLRWATHKEQSNNPVTLVKHKRNNSSEKMRRMGELINFNRKRVMVKKGNMIVGCFDSLRAASQNMKISYSKASEILNGKYHRKDGLSIFVIEE